MAVCQNPGFVTPPSISSDDVRHIRLLPIRHIPPQPDYLPIPIFRPSLPCMATRPVAVILIVEGRAGPMLLLSPSRPVSRPDGVHTIGREAHHAPALPTSMPEYKPYAILMAAATAVVIAATAIVVTATVVTATAVVVVTAATATMGGLKLLGSGIAYGLHCAFETHVLAGKRMVEVHHYVIGGDLLDKTVDTEAVGGHHGHESAGMHHLGIKFAVDHEYILFQSGNLFKIVVTESIGCLDFNVVDVTGSLSFKLGFERFYHTGSDSKDKLFGVLGVYLMNESLTAIGIYLIQIVGDFDIFAGFDFFHKCCIVVNSFRYDSNSYSKYCAKNVASVAIRSSSGNHLLYFI